MINMGIKKIFIGILIAAIGRVSCDSPAVTNSTTVSVNSDYSSDVENVFNDNADVSKETSETTTITTERIITEQSVNTENETEPEMETTIDEEIQTTEIDTEPPAVVLKNVEEGNAAKNETFFEKNTTSTQFFTINTTITNATLSPSPLNFTTIKTTTDTVKPDDKKKSLTLSFNLNYLYLLLLVIPILGILIFIYWYCKKKRKPAGYVEPRAQKTKRFSTPSWVFSEPDFQDEEITTLEEEKKL